MSKYFRAANLVLVAHNDQTRKIFSRLPNGEKSKFIREAILEYAIERGFSDNQFDEHDQRPEYLTPEQWQLYLKSEYPPLRYQFEGRKISYTYYLAYHWLRHNVARFQICTQASMQREIVTAYI